MKMTNQTQPTPEAVAAALQTIDRYAPRLMPPERAAEFCRIVRQSDNVAVAIADYFTALQDTYATVKEAHGPEVAAQFIGELHERVRQIIRPADGGQQSLAE